MNKKTGAFFNSSQSRNRWAFVLILVIFIATALISFGKEYNQASDYLYNKTGNLVRLPKVKEINFRLGLDLQGGTQLVYNADMSKVPDADKISALDGVREVIERRVNVFGVSEPLIQTNRTMAGDYRIVAELAGIQDVNEAVKMIGETPLLEFKEVLGDVVSTTADQNWINTNLTGKNLKRATVQFSQVDGTSQVSLEFDAEGAKLFEEITAKNIGKPVAIYLDNYPISIPRVDEKISGGKAVINGSFSSQEAKLLAQRLNTGALPVPINLMSQETVGATLGQKSIANSVRAGLIGLLLISLFMVILYRLPGVLAVGALVVYGLISLAIFKLWPVTLTLSGIAGFILSMGMAVDANILIFERMKEEMKAGKSVGLSVREGFNRAWPSIRDSNITTAMVCLILITFSSSVIKGFATTLLLGVAISMFTAILITRNFLMMIGEKFFHKRPWLFVGAPKEIIKS